MDPTARTTAVERRSIDIIPDDERHGSVRSLFTVWFAGNMQITTVVTGALGVALGLSLGWALLALLIGNLFGAVFMALHSAQGPKLGIPQMIQSRAQFGFLGAILPLILVLLMYVGFFASSAVLGGEALRAITGANDVVCIVLVSAACTVLAAYGYRLIHSYEHWVSLVSGLGFLALTVLLFLRHPVGASFHFGHTTFGTFLAVVAIAATWQITYAPYVADYSRYLPRHTSVRSAFWWTYGGTVIGAVWMMWLGAAVTAVVAPQGADVAAVVGLAPAHTARIFSAVLILGVIAINVLNLYGMFMSVTTTLTAIRPFVVRSRLRVSFVVASAVVGTTVALAGRGNFLSNYENFILFLAYFLIPWTAINLADFYLLRKERYDLAAVFDPHGRYGGVSWQAMVAYLAGVAVEIPFISSAFYTGPMVTLLGDADISWILGLIVSAALYHVLMLPLVRREHLVTADSTAIERQVSR